MTREVKLSRIERVLEDLSYPISREAVAEECGDVTLLLADGTENLGDLIAGSSAESFATPDELSNEVMNQLPRHAVGEPFQSEGEG